MSTKSEWVLFIWNIHPWICETKKKRKLLCGLEKFHRYKDSSVYFGKRLCSHHSEMCVGLCSTVAREKQTKEERWSSVCFNTSRAETSWSTGENKHCEAVRCLRACHCVRAEERGKTNLWKGLRVFVFVYYVHVWAGSLIVGSHLFQRVVNLIVILRLWPPLARGPIARLFFNFPLQIGDKHPARCKKKSQNGLWLVVSHLSFQSVRSLFVCFTLCKCLMSGKLCIWQWISQNLAFSSCACFLLFKFLTSIIQVFLLILIIPQIQTPHGPAYHHLQNVTGVCHWKGSKTVIITIIGSYLSFNSRLVLINALLVCLFLRLIPSNPNSYFGF